MNYRELRDYLNQLNEEQLEQTVQIVPYEFSDEGALELDNGVTIDTCEALELNQGGRQVVDNKDGKYHPEHIVIVADTCYCYPDGSIGFNLKTGERVYPHGHEKSKGDS